MWHESCSRACATNNPREYIMKRAVLSALLLTAAMGAQTGVIIDNTVSGTITNDFNALATGNVAGQYHPRHRLGRLLRFQDHRRRPDRGRVTHESRYWWYWLRQRHIQSSSRWRARTRHPRPAGPGPGWSRLRPLAQGLNNFPAVNQTATSVAVCSTQSAHSPPS